MKRVEKTEKGYTLAIGQKSMQITAGETEELVNMYHALVHRMNNDPAITGVQISSKGTASWLTTAEALFGTPENETFTVSSVHAGIGVNNDPDMLIHVDDATKESEGG